MIQKNSGESRFLIGSKGNIWRRMETFDKPRVGCGLLPRP
jgi:hypothetical protein